MQSNLIKEIISKNRVIPKTLSVDINEEPVSNDIAIEFDVALLDAGFRANLDVLMYISQLDRVNALIYTKDIIESIKKIVGSHVEHNVYFIDFPENVPNTREFWYKLVQDTFGNDPNLWNGNLLELNTYGEYQHTYEEMVKLRENFTSKSKRRLRELKLGGSLESEGYKIYLSLAESKTPLKDYDKELLGFLAEMYLGHRQPETIPVRENRAIINKTRIQKNKTIEIDTVVDVLRLAVMLSDQDPDLTNKPMFKNFTRPIRRELIRALDTVITENPAKIYDAYRHKESFKRLLFRLRLNKEFPYNVAKLSEYVWSGKNQSFESRLEKAFNDNSIDKVLKVLEKKPGLFMKSINRLLLKFNESELKDTYIVFEQALKKIDTKGLFNVAQFFSNRMADSNFRLFMNKKGTGKFIRGEYKALPQPQAVKLYSILEKEIKSRLDKTAYVVNSNMLGVAIPTSQKNEAEGLDVLPRGSVDIIDADYLRLFLYWKESKQSTDYDLSLTMLDGNYDMVSQISYTHLSSGLYATHSGDITSAKNGASEFIDINLIKMPKNVKYIVPQILVYSGENFKDAEEAFFGYMERTPEEKGLPFEPKTVVTKSDLYTKGSRVVLPLVLVREQDGFKIKWAHLGVQGANWGNNVESTHITTSSLVQAIVETNYINVRFLTELIESNPDCLLVASDGLDEEEITNLEAIYESIIYIGEPNTNRDIREDDFLITRRNITMDIF